MATMRPHLAPRQPTPPPPPSLPPPATGPALPRSPYTRCRTADVHGRKESVAESCCPREAAGTVIDDDVDIGSDDDGCGSCVDGSEGSAGQDEERSGVDVWWSQGSSSRCFLWPPNANRTTTASYGHSGDESDEDPNAEARRQEEDRKFWEACLASGYP